MPRQQVLGFGDEVCTPIRLYNHHPVPGPLRRGMEIERAEPIQISAGARVIQRALGRCIIQIDCSQLQVSVHSPSSSGPNGPLSRTTGQP